MLAEELILHFAPAVFKGYKIKSKSLLRITRNADIDANALYDEDLDYREFMEGLIKQKETGTDSSGTFQRYRQKRNCRIM